jgi:hypothetical protein
VLAGCYAFVFGEAPFQLCVTAIRSTSSTSPRLLAPLLIPLPTSLPVPVLLMLLTS